MSRVYVKEDRIQVGCGLGRFVDCWSANTDDVPEIEIRIIFLKGVLLSTGVY